MWLVTLDKRQHNGTTFGFDIQTLFSDRFKDDKLFEYNDKGFFIQDGVLLNKSLLLNKGQEFSECIESISESEALYFKHFKGPFTGCHYNAKTDIFIAFGNQTGDAAVFYYDSEKYFAVSSDFNMLFNWCRDRDLQLSFNQVAANHIMSFGFVTEGNTIVEEIRKQNPGEYIELKNKRETSIDSYHHFTFGSYSITNMKEAIQTVDKGFRNAVRLCFEKDKEYGYELKAIDGTVFHFDSQDLVEANYHLWTIQDAKDGDVLVASDGSIFIFNSSDNDGCKFHVALTTDNKLVIDHKLKHHWKTSTAIHPATKKQRDTLTKAMLSLGYTFDFDKKELKKIKKESKKIKKESKNSNSYCQEHCKGFQETGKCFADGDCKDKIDAKQDENDEKMIDEIIVDIEVLKEQEMTKYGKELYQEEIDWLKSLKQKIGG